MFTDADAPTDTEPVELAERLARAGWLAKGALFVVVGFLGLEMARRNYRNEDADQGGALELISSAPAGRVLVFVVGVGLLLFALWEFWSALADDHDDLLDLGHRVGRFGVGLAYGGIGVTGIEAAIRGSRNVESEGGPTSPDGLAARLFDVPGGRWIVAIIGLGTAAIGLYQVWRNVRRGFLEDVELDDLDEAWRRVLETVGAVGLTARALLLEVAGVLFVVAAWRYDPDEAAGLDQSLRTIAEPAFGRLAVAAVAVGLIASGLYDMATFRRQKLD